MSDISDVLREKGCIVGDDNQEPGKFPYTRGIHKTMYRVRDGGKLWTMRQFAGFGSPKNTNARFKHLIQLQGEKEKNSQNIVGLSTAFDMPTLMGYDADHIKSRGEVGKEGVSVSCLSDMEELFEGIPLNEVSVSMTINATATIIFAMYLVMAEKRGIPWTELKGTLQNDMLKEFIAQREWISPPHPSVKLVVDTIEFCRDNVPLWHPVSISGYHIREAGSTAAQELAFTVADGICYVEECRKRGMAVDSFAPRLSFFFDVHNNFFEEIAKFRAARCMWAEIMKERFGAHLPKSMMLKTHAQTAGVTLTAQQPMNNIARVTLQALAAVLAGVQSLHTNSMDETLSLPTENAVTVALRTQQIIAEELKITELVDPLGGSHALETITDGIKKEAYAYIKTIDEMGGMIAAVEQGYPQKEIANASYEYEQKKNAKEEIVVGVNKYVMEEKQSIPVHAVDEEVEQEQVVRLEKRKKERNAKKAEAALNEIRRAARAGENIFPSLLEAVRADVTVGEISDVFREVYGAYKDPGYV